MATQQIGNIGANLDLLIRQGATFGPITFIGTNPAIEGSPDIPATPLDLTSCIVRGKIKKKPKDTVVVATFVVNVTDAAGGVFTIGLTDETTATIPAGESQYSSQSKYVYDLELQDSQGNVLPLFYGNAYVFREVTT